MKNNIMDLNKVLEENGFIIGKEENYITVRNDILITTWYFTNKKSNV